MTNRIERSFSNPIELPLTEIADAADRACEEAFNNLKFLKKSNSVRCQCCHKAIHIVGKMTRSQNDRIAVLEKKMKRIEAYNKTSSSTTTDDIKKLKQELAELYVEDEKRDRLRHLPLYS